jgi:hypothetical protein
MYPAPDFGKKCRRSKKHLRDSKGRFCKKGKSTEVVTKKHMMKMKRRSKSKSRSKSRK